MNHSDPAAVAADLNAALDALQADLAAGTRSAAPAEEPLEQQLFSAFYHS